MGEDLVGFRAREGTIHEVEPIRARAWGRAACAPFTDHHWVRINTPGVPDVTLCIVCEECGRDPLEALGALPVVVSR